MQEAGAASLPRCRSDSDAGTVDSTTAGRRPPLRETPQKQKKKIADIAKSVHCEGPADHQRVRRSVRAVRGCHASAIAAALVCALTFTALHLAGTKKLCISTT